MTNTDALSIIEAAYDVERSADIWLATIAKRVRANTGLDAAAVLLLRATRKLGAKNRAELIATLQSQGERS